MKTHNITLDDLPYVGRKLVLPFDSLTRRKILDRMHEKMQQAESCALQLTFLTSAIIEIREEAKSAIPDGADPRIAKLAMDQYRRGDFLTSEAYIAELGGL